MEKNKKNNFFHKNEFFTMAHGSNIPLHIQLISLIMRLFFWLKIMFLNNLILENLLFFLIIIFRKILIIFLFVNRIFLIKLYYFFISFLFFILNLFSRLVLYFFLINKKIISLIILSIIFFIFFINFYNYQLFNNYKDKFIISDHYTFISAFILDFFDLEKKYTYSFTSPTTTNFTDFVFVTEKSSTATSFSYNINNFLEHSNVRHFGNWFLNMDSLQYWTLRKTYNKGWMPYDMIVNSLEQPSLFLLFIRKIQFFVNYFFIIIFNYFFLFFIYSRYLFLNSLFFVDNFILDFYFFKVYFVDFNYSIFNIIFTLDNFFFFKFLVFNFSIIIGFFNSVLDEIYGIFFRINSYSNLLIGDTINIITPSFRSKYVLKPRHWYEHTHFPIILTKDARIQEASFFENVNIKNKNNDFFFSNSNTEKIPFYFLNRFFLKKRKTFIDDNPYLTDLVAPDQIVPYYLLNFNLIGLNENVYHFHNRYNFVSNYKINWAGEFDIFKGQTAKPSPFSYKRFLGNFFIESFNLKQWSKHNSKAFFNLSNLYSIHKDNIYYRDFFDFIYEKTRGKFLKYNKKFSFFVKLYYNSMFFNLGDVNFFFPEKKNISNVNDIFVTSEKSDQYYTWNFQQNILPKNSLYFNFDINYQSRYKHLQRDPILLMQKHTNFLGDSLYNFDISEYWSPLRIKKYSLGHFQLIRFFYNSLFSFVELIKYFYFLLIYSHIIFYLYLYLFLFIFFLIFFTLEWRKFFFFNFLIIIFFLYKKKVLSYILQSFNFLKKSLLVSSYFNKYFYFHSYISFERFFNFFFYFLFFFCFNFFFILFSFFFIFKYFFFYILKMNFQLHFFSLFFINLKNFINFTISFFFKYLIFIRLKFIKYFNYIKTFSDIFNLFFVFLVFFKYFSFIILRILVFLLKSFIVLAFSFCSFLLFYFLFFIEKNNDLFFKINLSILRRKSESYFYSIEDSMFIWFSFIFLIFIILFLLSLFSKKFNKQFFNFNLNNELDKLNKSSFPFSSDYFYLFKRDLNTNTWSDADNEDIIIGSTITNIPQNINSKILWNVNIGLTSEPGGVLNYNENDLFNSQFFDFVKTTAGIFSGNYSFFFDKEYNLIYFSYFYREFFFFKKIKFVFSILYSFFFLTFYFYNLFFSLFYNSNILYKNNFFFKDYLVLFLKKTFFIFNFIKFKKYYYYYFFLKGKYNFIKLLFISIEYNHLKASKLISNRVTEDKLKVFKSKVESKFILIKNDLLKIKISDDKEIRERHEQKIEMNLRKVEDDLRFDFLDLSILLEDFKEDFNQGSFKIKFNQFTFKDLTYLFNYSFLNINKQIEDIFKYKEKIKNFNMKFFNLEDFYSYLYFRYYNNNKNQSSILIYKNNFLYWIGSLFLKKNKDFLETFYFSYILGSFLEQQFLQQRTNLDYFHTYLRVKRRINLESLEKEFSRKKKKKDKEQEQKQIGLFNLVSSRDFSFIFAFSNLFYYFNNYFYLKRKHYIDFLKTCYLESLNSNLFGLVLLEKNSMNFLKLISKSKFPLTNYSVNFVYLNSNRDYLVLNILNKRFIANRTLFIQANNNLKIISNYKLIHNLKNFLNKLDYKQEDPKLTSTSSALYYLSSLFFPKYYDSDSTGWEGVSKKKGYVYHKNGLFYRLGGMFHPFSLMDIENEAVFFFDSLFKIIFERELNLNRMIFLNSNKLLNIFVFLIKHHDSKQVSSYMKSNLLYNKTKMIRITSLSSSKLYLGHYFSKSLLMRYFSNEEEDFVFGEFSFDLDFDIMIESEDVGELEPSNDVFLESTEISFLDRYEANFDSDFSLTDDLDIEELLYDPLNDEHPFFEHFLNRKFSYSPINFKFNLKKDEYWPYAVFLFNSSFFYSDKFYYLNAGWFIDCFCDKFFFYDSYKDTIKTPLEYFPLANTDLFTDFYFLKNQVLSLNQNVMTNRDLSFNIISEIYRRNMPFFIMQQANKFFWFRHLFPFLNVNSLKQVDFFFPLNRYNNMISLKEFNNLEQNFNLNKNVELNTKVLPNFIFLFFYNPYNYNFMYQLKELLVFRYYSMTYADFFKNQYTIKFYENFTYYVSLLDLRTFPDFTQEEIERLWTFLGCTKNEWENVESISSKKILMPFDYWEIILGFMAIIFFVPFSVKSNIWDVYRYYSPKTNETFPLSLLDDEGDGAPGHITAYVLESERMIRGQEISSIFHSGFPFDLNLLDPLVWIFYVFPFVKFFFSELMYIIYDFFFFLYVLFYENSLIYNNLSFLDLFKSFFSQYTFSDNFYWYFLSSFFLFFYFFIITLNDLFLDCFYISILLSFDSYFIIIKVSLITKLIYFFFCNTFLNIILFIKYSFFIIEFNFIKYIFLYFLQLIFFYFINIYIIFDNFLYFLIENFFLFYNSIFISLVEDNYLTPKIFFLLIYDNLFFLDLLKIFFLIYLYI